MILLDCYQITMRLVLLNLERFREYARRLESAVMAHTVEWTAFTRGLGQTGVIVRRMHKRLDENEKRFNPVRLIGRDTIRRLDFFGNPDISPCVPNLVRRCMGASTRLSADIQPHEEIVTFAEGESHGALHYAATVSSAPIRKNPAGRWDPASNARNRSK